ncbi:MAG: Hpt domain-containing protein [Pseudomonadota bacterium]
MSTKILDHAMLKKLLHMIGGEAEDFDEMKGEFLDAVPDILADLHTTDTDALRIASHSLKGNAQDFGAAQLTELCATLETQCKDGTLGDPGPLVADITTAAHAAMGALRELEATDLD